MPALSGPSSVSAVAGLAVSAAGWLLLGAGVLLFPLPGPGLLLGAVGLSLLARRHAWAARRVERVRLTALLGAARGVRTPMRTAVTVMITVTLGASGALWLWAPVEPGWWPFPGWTWLPGGWWSGIGQIGSGVVALAFALDARRRFGDRPDAVDDLTERLRHLGRV